MTNPAQMQKASSIWRKKGYTVAFVPTMGALHDGHKALIERAVQLADRVVVSAYVNPAQFNSKGDFFRYPRRPNRDRQLAGRAGADIYFCPKTLYALDASTWVEEVNRSQGRCGARRRGHFRGVATVVVKLLSIVQPNWMILGEKDGQQCEVLERVARDLYLPVEILRHPTVREKDGLPMSSRNLRLTTSGRTCAGLWAGKVRDAARKGARVAVRNLRRSLRGQSSIRLEYAEVVGGKLWAAARVGNVRLIDHRKCDRP